MLPSTVHGFFGLFIFWLPVICNFCLAVCRAGSFILFLQTSTVTAAGNAAFLLKSGIIECRASTKHRIEFALRCCSLFLEGEKKQLLLQK